MRSLKRLAPLSPYAECSKSLILFPKRSAGISPSQVEIPSCLFPQFKGQEPTRLYPGAPLTPTQRFPEDFAAGPVFFVILSPSSWTCLFALCSRPGCAGFILFPFFSSLVLCLCVFVLVCVGLLWSVCLLDSSTPMPSDCFMLLFLSSQN